MMNCSYVNLYDDFFSAKKGENLRNRKATRELNHHLRNTKKKSEEKMKTKTTSMKKLRKIMIYNRMSHKQNEKKVSQ